MKKMPLALLVTSVIIILTSIAFCFVWTKKVDQGLVAISNPVYDFGILKEGAVLTHKFVLENKSRKQLNIKDIKAGCGCTETLVDKKSLEPGEQCNIKVTYVGRRVNHRENISLLILSDHSKTPKVGLRLTGEIDVKVFWYPKSASFYFESNDMQEQVQEVQLVVKKMPDLNIQNIQPSSKRIEVTTEKNNKGFLLKIIAKSDCAKGNWSDSISITFGADNKIEDILIPVYITRL